MDIPVALSHLLASQPLAVTTDFDGTISHIAPTPERAVLHSRCQDVLTRLAERLPLVAVVSGRSADDLRRLVGVPGAVYLGGHGLERWQQGTTHIDPSAVAHLGTIRSILGAARQALATPGLVFEEKETGASIHYRLAPDPEVAREHVVSVLRDLTRGAGVEVVEGRRVIELRPDVQIDKGSALFDLLSRHDLGAAIYAGDDWTDLAAFSGLHRWASEQGGTALAVAVASSEMPPALRETADLTLPGVDGWVDFLDALLTGLSEQCSA